MEEREERMKSRKAEDLNEKSAFDILLYDFFCFPQMKESHMGLERHE